MLLTRLSVRSAIVCGLLASYWAMPVAAEKFSSPAVSVDSGLPDVKELDAILYPPDRVALSVECIELQKNNRPCGSVVPGTGLTTSLITFGRGSATLTSQGKAILDRLGTVFSNRKDVTAELVVQGHTDATGTDDINRPLSKKRAESVKSYLSTKYGINNIQTVGKGSEDLADKANPGAEVNRRIQFKVSFPGQ